MSAFTNRSTSVQPGSSAVALRRVALAVGAGSLALTIALTGSASAKNKGQGGGDDNDDTPTSSVVSSVAPAALTRRVRRVEAERVELLRAAISASTRERERIAADLHDGVVQSLAGLSFDLGASARMATDSTTRKAFERSADTARHGMQTLRAALLDLHPDRATTMDVNEAMESLAEELRAAGPTVDVTVSGTCDDLSDAQRSLVFRVARELTRNVAAHSRATSAAVDFAVDSSRVRLVVRDNGRGFDDETRRTRRTEGHLGLDLHSALVERAGGSLTIRQARPNGTIATLELPR